MRFANVFAMLPWVPMLTHEKRHVSVMYTWHGFPHVNMGGVSASPTPSGPTPTSEPRVSTYAACQHGVARADMGGMPTQADACWHGVCVSMVRGVSLRMACQHGPVCVTTDVRVNTGRGVSLVRMACQHGLRCVTISNMFTRSPQAPQAGALSGVLSRADDSKRDACFICGISDERCE